MFVETKREGESQDLHSVGRLISWLEKQPLQKIYSYVNPASCLLAQYLKAQGHYKYCLKSGEAKAFFGDDGFIIVGRDYNHQWTFGDALKRARKVAAEM